MALRLLAGWLAAYWLLAAEFARSLATPTICMETLARSHHVGRTSAVLGLWRENYDAYPLCCRPTNAMRRQPSWWTRRENLLECPSHTGRTFHSTAASTLKSASSGFSTASAIVRRDVHCRMYSKLHTMYNQKYCCSVIRGTGFPFLATTTTSARTRDLQIRPEYRALYPARRPGIEPGTLSYHVTRYIVSHLMQKTVEPRSHATKQNKD